MNAVLSEYKIACVTPTDDIFLNSFGRPEKQIEYPEAIALSPINEEEAKRPNDTMVDSEIAVESTPSAHEMAFNTKPSHQVIAEKPTVTVKTQERAASPLPEIDRDALKIYKKIPMDVECEVESLVDESHDLRVVMKTLLKLEMSRFVVMLPGDKVKRNLK
jgi:hypothetical protein